MLDQNEYLFEESVGPQVKRAAVMIGRMNPPTAGHYKVVNSMKEFIRKNPELKLVATPIIVIVDGEKTSQDKSKNPLTAHERISFMKSSGRANGAIFLTAPTGFDAWEEVRKAGYEPIAVAAGSDRADKYIQMLNKYFKDSDGETIKHVKIPGLERDEPGNDKKDSKSAMQAALAKLEQGGKLDDAEVSGSMARAAVMNGFEDAFAKIVGLENKPKLAALLFKKVKSAMGDQDA